MWSSKQKMAKNGLAIAVVIVYLIAMAAFIIGLIASGGKNKHHAAVYHAHSGINQPTSDNNRSANKSGFQDITTVTVDGKSYSSRILLNGYALSQMQFGMNTKNQWAASENNTNLLMWVPDWVKGRFDASPLPVNKYQMYFNADFFLADSITRTTPQWSFWFVPTQTKNYSELSLSFTIDSPDIAFGPFHDLYSPAPITLINLDTNVTTVLHSNTSTFQSTNADKPSIFWNPIANAGSFTANQNYIIVFQFSSSLLFDENINFTPLDNSDDTGFASGSTAPGNHAAPTRT